MVRKGSLSVSESEGFMPFYSEGVYCSVYSLFCPGGKGGGSSEVQNYFVEHIVSAVVKWQLEHSESPSLSNCASMQSPLG